MYNQLLWLYIIVKIINIYIIYTTGVDKSVLDVYTEKRNVYKILVRSTH